jgi:peptidoglycan hydrolase-like protein with peptidoglycan-binding domain
MPNLNAILSLNAQGDQVKAAQANLVKIGAAVPTTETSAGVFGTGTADAIKQFQIASKLPATGMVDAATQAMLNNAAAVAAANQSSMSGQIAMEYGLAANAVTVRVYSIGYGGAATKLAEAKTDANGVYSLAYTPPAAGSNLEVRAVNAQGQETTISSTIFNAAARTVLNLVAPASVQPLTAEFARLSADVQTAIGGAGIANLGNAQESATQQDLTLLNSSTGWDARLLALAATAANQSATTGVGSDVLYALYRTGMPSDPQLLALIPAATIATALNKATQAGIVSFTAQQITAAQTAFTTFATKTNLAIKVPGAPSSLGDLLSPVVTNATQQASFIQTFLDPTKADADLWTSAASAGIPAAQVASLQLQGKLAFLTLNNASLVQKVQQVLAPATAGTNVPATSTVDLAALADADFHLDATWINAVNSIAGTDTQKLQSLIPANYGGATPSDQLAAYAADMARKVRVSFPTRVIARMATTGTLGLDATTSPKVGAFLKAADNAGYQLGSTPLNAFLKKLPASVAAPDAATVASVKTLHRLYQITPSNESLQSAVKLNFSSARDIVAYKPDDFVGRFGSSFPSVAEAQLVYNKAQQIAAVTLNAFATAKQLDVQPEIFAFSGSSSARQTAKTAIAQQFPSMAGLFGSRDFCECDDCKSVLSPAAYLVDILHFLDPNPSEWQSTLNAWKSSHGNHAYPFGTPFQSLTARRPDLPNLNLSCENTNTALPYIDVVNEILEYFIAKNGLQNLSYDTGSANSADLVAEPQNILPAAYSILNNSVAVTAAVYPLGLPFDLWIETVRGFLNFFKLSLWQVLDLWRPVDALELLTDASHYPYYRSAIFIESLGFSPSERALLTNAATLTNWFQLYGYANQPSALAALTSAETLADTLDITYQDLADIMQSGFVNPALAPLTIPLEKFGLSIRDVFNYTSQPGFNSPAITAAQKTAFETQLQGLMQQYYPTADPKGLQNWLNSFLTAGYSNSVLVLKAPSNNSCDFEHTTLQYGGGNAANNLDFLKINLFVRIWKKLGWTINEVDRALQLFLTPWMPAPTDANLGADLATAMTSALIYLSHLQTVADKLQPGPYGRIGILPIWSALPTAGVDPLYSQLFLTAAVLNNDPIFDNAAGQYLSYFDTTQNKYLPFRWQSSQTAEDVANGYVLLGNHLPAIQGALGVTSDEVQAILADNGLDIASAPLTLANVTLLYRYALLSQGLQLSVEDFVALKELSIDTINATPFNPVNPFDPLAAAAMAVLKDDRPWGETVQFCDQAAKVQASGFSVDDLQYLLCQKIADPAGPYAPDPDAVMQQIRGLAAVIHAIQSQTAVPPDPTTFTDNVIRQNMAQLFPPDVAGTFMGMWSGTIQYTATPVAAASAIPPIVLPNVQLVYDPVLTTQTVILTGVPVSSVMAALTAALGTLVTGGAITAAQQTLLQGLFNDIHKQALTFFQNYLQQTSVGGQTTGFLQPGDFDTLFAAPQPTAATRASLAAKVLPYLQNHLIDEAIVQTLVAQFAADPSLMKTLLTNTSVLTDPTQPPAPPVPLLNGFLAAGENGLSVTYYSGAQEVSTGVIGTATVKTANTDSVTNPSKPAGVNSAHFEGYLEVSADGPYLFTAILPNSTATAALQFDFLSAPLALSAGTPSGTPTTYPYSGYTQFKAGIPYHFTLDVQGLNGGDAHLLVQGESKPQGPLGNLTLYSEASVLRYTRSQVLLAKSLQLIQGFGLDENEVLYFAANPADFSNASFNSLPTQASDFSVAKAQTLFGQFLRLAAYAALRKGPAGGTDGLIDVFQNARQTVPLTPLPAGVTSAAQLAAWAANTLYQALANVTRRDIPTIQSVIQQLWGTGAIQTTTNATTLQFICAPLVNEIGFSRLWTALQMVQNLGVQPQVLTQTTGIVSASRATVSPDPGFGIAAALRNAVKSQYQPDQWRPLAQSIFDPLRQKKRDALCAFILGLPVIRQFGATDTNGLFEYFLVDPGMEPVVQTSRIRLALSSVQTFIQRCLLNLETQVKPSVIDASRWEWMKRYRVWEANREIFLWPENWLIPEFRENATDLFQSLQGILLQGNITQDLVEKAFTQYLQDLDTRARLDIVTMFNQAATLGDPSSSNTLHVIGRHHGKPMKYFYRTFSNDIWSGWIPVTTDIEGDHIVAVIWRGRLNLFWLTFAIRGATTPPNQAQAASGDSTPPSTKLTDLHFTDLGSLVLSAKPPRTVQIQLNWSEYYQGKWTPRRSSDINRFPAFTVNDSFDVTSGVHVRASIDTDANGNETAVRVHMDGIYQAFRLTGKNAEPACGSAYWQNGNYMPYADAGWDASKYVGYAAPSQGSADLKVTYVKSFTTVNGVLKSSPAIASQEILQTVNSFNLLMCDNVAPFDTSNAYNLYMSSLIAASSPFFYEDTGDLKSNQELTFFVQPKLKETSITRWRGWVIRPEFPNWTIAEPTYWNNLQLAPQVPFRVPPLPDPEAVFRYQPNVDLIAAKSTVIPFGATLIGKTGAALTAAPTAGLRATENLSNERLLTALGTTAPGFLKVTSTAALDSTVKVAGLLKA